MTTLINNTNLPILDTNLPVLDTSDVKQSCVLCNEYYGTMETDNKCSYCFIGKDRPLCYRDPTFRKMLDQYVVTKLASKTHQILLEKSLKKKTDGTVRYIFDIMNKDDTYITAKFGFKLKKILNIMSLPEKEKRNISYIICSIIIDWWNMRDYSFTSAEMCYFGRFGDKYYIDEIKTIPPPLNSRINTLKLFKIIK